MFHFLILFHDFEGRKMKQNAVGTVIDWRTGYMFFEYIFSTARAKKALYEYKLTHSVSKFLSFQINFTVDSAVKNYKL